MTAVWIVLIALALLVFLFGLLVVGLLRSHADILRRLEGLGAGLEGDGHGHGQLTLTRKTAASVAQRTITGVTPDGEPVVASLAAGSDPTLVAFLSTTCSTCTPFWEGLESAMMYFGGRRHRVVVVTLGESEESPTRAQSLAKSSAEVIMSSQGWSDFEVPGAPFFVLIEAGTGRVIGEGSSLSFESLEEFLTDATNDQEWDLSVGGPDDPGRVDDELRRAGILPGDPRLHPKKDDIEEDRS